jgi:hypothetical protein
MCLKISEVPGTGRLGPTEGTKHGDYWSVIQQIQAGNAGFFDVSQDRTKG